MGKKAASFIYILVLCLAAWILSGVLRAGISHLNPLSLSVSAHCSNIQSLILYFSADDNFSSTSSLRAQIPAQERSQAIRFSVPPHLAANMRLGFSKSNGTVLFSAITLEGQPLDLIQASHYQMRNVRSCEPAQGNLVSCRIAGEQAHITFPPEQLAPLVNVALWKGVRALFFIFSFAILFLIYKRYQNFFISFLQKYYRLCLLNLLLIILFYSYSSVLWHIFHIRLVALFLSPNWTSFLFLLQEHFAVLSVLLGSLVLISILSNRYLQILTLILSSLFLFAEILDCALLQLLNARFSPDQIIEFGPSFLTFGPFVKSYLLSQAGLYTLLTGFCWAGLCFYAWTYKLSQNSKKLLTILSILGFVWYLIPASLEPAERRDLSDWIRLSLPSQISPNLLRISADKFELSYHCQEGLNTQKNVMIILLESFSPYMSHHFSEGKGENWTPRLDALAQKYISHKKYHTTNFATSQSLFAILTGFPAIHLLPAYNLYKEPKFYQHNLSKIFRKAGYHTAFFTSSSLVYSKDNILKNTFFDEISKDNDPFYDEEKRFVFHSVPDDILYERIKKWLSDYRQDKPYLMIVESTTSHSPFVDPVSGDDNSVEKTIRYADQALGNFIDYLQEQNILEDTIVVILSDHRIMLPITQTASDLFGEEAESAVPFVILGAPVPMQEKAFSHIDLAPSLAFLTLPKACFHQYQNNMFSSEEIDSSCRFFQSFIEKEKVLIHCQNQHLQLALMQDFNIFLKGDIAEKEKKSLLSFIDWIRHDNQY